MVARFTKLTGAVGEKFYLLLVVLAVTCIISILQKNSGLMPRLFYAFLFVMTVYALILTPGAEPRAFFGAGVFLIVACVQGIADCVRTEKESGSGSILCRTLAYGITAAMMISMFFTYVECGAHLLRIRRDTWTREAALEKAAEEGAQYVEVYRLHTAFDNKYTCAFYGGSEPTEDPGYWVNLMYEAYYGIPEISAIEPE